VRESGRHATRKAGSVFQVHDKSDNEFYSGKSHFSIASCNSYLLLRISHFKALQYFNKLKINITLSKRNQYLLIVAHNTNGNAATVSRTGIKSC